MSFAQTLGADLLPEPQDLALVINSYNRRDLLERSLRSVYENVHPTPGEIVVVDDRSTDGSGELVEQLDPVGALSGIGLVRPDHKVAFAGGVNLGISSCRAPYVCLFETDNVALDDGLWKGVAYLKQHRQVAGVGFRVTTLAGATAGNSMSFPSPLAFVLGQQIASRLGLESPATDHRRDVVFTSPLIVSRSRHRSGWPHERRGFPVLRLGHRLVPALPRCRIRVARDGRRLRGSRPR